MFKNLKLAFYELFCIIILQACIVLLFFGFKFWLLIFEISAIFLSAFLLKFIYNKTEIIYQEREDIAKRFFNDCMHELKTPLGVAMINIEMLQIHNKYTHRIKSALKQMKLTYEDVEYFIKNRHINFKAKRMNISKFLNDRIKFSHIMANVKNIKISSQIKPDLEIFISEIELTRLIDNTINNAIKYTNENGKIEISLANDENFAKFCVKDNGIGIKDTKKIWKRYERENLSSGGFGLGLAIVKNICDKYKIKKNVISNFGAGSTFIYEIPLFKEKFLDKFENDNQLFGKT